MKTQSPVKMRGIEVSEMASDWVFSNYYITIGLTRSQCALLKETAARWGFKEQPCARAARMLVQLGLANLPQVEKRGQVYANRCRAKHLFLTTYLDDLAAHTMRELAGMKKRQPPSIHHAGPDPLSSASVNHPLHHDDH